MKKIFTLALAGAASISMMAAPLPASKLAHNVEDMVLATSMKNAKGNMMKRVPKRIAAKKALDAANFYGEWGFIAYSCTRGEYMLENMSIEKGSKENEIILKNFPYAHLEGFKYELSDMVGTVDFEAGTITVEPAQIAVVTDQTGQVPLSFCECAVEMTPQGKITKVTPLEDPIVLTYNEEIQGFALPEFTAITDNNNSFVYELYQNGYIQAGAVWNDLGMGKWTDGMLTTFFPIENADETFDVRIRENNLEAGWYRVMSPWAELKLFSDIGKGPSANVDILAMDPDCVLVPMTATDILFTDEQNPQNKVLFYVLNAAVAVGVGQEGGMSVDDFLADYSDMNATMADGVITIPGVGMLGYTEGAEQPVLADPKKARDTTIELPEGGIDDILSSDVNNANAPVEFFNIQGQRVTNPTAGQLVIRRQGTDVQKLIVR